MSFVGPRPERPEFVAELTRADSRSTASATSCGRASPAGRRCATATAPRVEDALEKLQYDLFYIKNMSLAFDLFIVLETVKTVLVRGRVVDAWPPRPQRDDDRRGGLLPRLGLRRRRLARSHWASFESRVVPQHRPAARAASTRPACAPRSSCSAGWPSGFPSSCGGSTRAGHELASHGYDHRLVYDKTPGRVPRRPAPRQGRRSRDAAGVDVTRLSRAELLGHRAVAVGARRAGQRRATPTTRASIPIRHDRYGIPSWPRHIHRVERAGRRLWELPGSTVRRVGMNLPMGGGGYFRLLPYWLDALGHPAR